jgi:hypothetical protein
MESLHLDTLKTTKKNYNRNTQSMSNITCSFCKQVGHKESTRRFKANSSYNKPSEPFKKKNINSLEMHVKTDDNQEQEVEEEVKNEEQNYSNNFISTDQEEDYSTEDEEENYFSVNSLKIHRLSKKR